MPRRAALAALALLFLVTTVKAAAPTFWRLEGAAAFLAGDLEGVSVDSEGRLRLGPEVRELFDPQAPNAWTVASAPDGALYVGTGNEGRVYRVDGKEGRVVFDAAQLEVYAVAVGPEGTVYAATSPDGAVYAVDSAGESTAFFDPEEKYIWALAVDSSGRLLVATGGDGRVYRVDQEGSAETLLSSNETHILSLALDDRGRVFAGSSPEGIVYRLDAPGKAFVLLDSDFREIKALAVDATGAVFAAAVNGGAAVPPVETAPPAPAASTGPAPVAQVTVTETFAVAAPAAPAPTVTVSSGAPGATPRGAVLRLDPDGAIETLWSSVKDAPHALAATPDGLLVGTGDEGKLYRVGADGTWALLGCVEAKQVTGLATRPGAETALVTSNPARVSLMADGPSGEGRFVSEVKDAQVVATWGRLRWEGSAPEPTTVRVATRSGNTAQPDATWAPWTDVAGAGRVVSMRSEAARFLQVRVTLGGGGEASPVVEALSAAYLQRNLRPRVDSITVHPPGQVFQKPISVTGEPEILGLDPASNHERQVAQGNAPAPATPVTAFSRKLQRPGLQTFAWTASDSNGDELVFDVQYRAVGDPQWRTLRGRLTEPVLAWDTTAVADGRYVIRITASDAPANPPSLALVGHEDSESFQVDNAPPAIEASLAPGNDRIRANVRDAGSPIHRLEFAVDAGPWQEVYPTDGINDSRAETYDFAVPPNGAGGPRVVVLRVSDLLGNGATVRVDVP